jgi:hypothetical protein
MTDTKLSPHFSDVEFVDWRNGHKWLTPTSRPRYVELANLSLEPIRAALGSSVKVVSGERKESKTAANSRHMPPELRPNPRERGKPNGSPDAAADIKSAGKTPLDIALTVIRLMASKAIPVGGVGIYPTFVHVDNRGRLASWKGTGVDDATWRTFRNAVADCATALRLAAEAGTDDEA